MNHFAYPWVFVLLLMPFIWRRFIPAIKGLHGDALRIPFIADLEKISIKSGGIWKINDLADGAGFSRMFWLLYVVWTFLVVAAARPQWLGEPVRLKNESRDIMLVLDISTSMLNQDFFINQQRIDRLTAVKKTASDFIKKRANDRIGLVLFGTRAYLQSPLTHDKQAVYNILWSMEAGMAGDSTSIGDAMGIALKNLKNQNKSQKVIVILTDGENNDGSLSMPQAIKLAADEGIKTYTIGVGSQRSFWGAFSTQIAGVDEKSLNDLAQATKGQYFRAESSYDLQKIYDLIDQLEADINENRFVRETKELFYIPLIAAIFMCLALIITLRRAE
ncbi:MAG: VWA domain-containing protein [Alphaproteobacteria bacterium]|nr:VWA domain-containing protein [Alphaproteobacteria bacterium]